MKRIKTVLLFIFLATGSAINLESQQIRFDAHYQNSDTVEYMTGITDASPLVDELLDADSHFSISFETRLYQRRGGFSALFGDAMLGTDTIELLISRDLIACKYSVTQEKSVNYFDSREELLHYISAIRGQFVLDSALNSGKQFYLKARCRISVNIMEPPLRIIELFFMNRNIQLNWVTFSLDNGKK